VIDPPVNPSGDAAEATSLTLLEKARSGSEAAWERIDYLYTPLVSRWCRRAGLQEADVDDVCNEVLMALHRSLPGFEKRPEHGSFRGWLRTITRNKIRDFWGQTRPDHQGPGGSDAYEQFLEIPAREDAPRDSSADEDNSLLYRRALELIRCDFSEPVWKAFLRVVIDGQPAADVAEELNTTPAAVYSARARVLARLREFRGLLGDEAALCGLVSEEHQGGANES
jgi:RNA polymerase sigma-70 factor (ECF subfamily)